MPRRHAGVATAWGWGLGRSGDRAWLVADVAHALAGSLRVATSMPEAVRVVRQPPLLLLEPPHDVTTPQPIGVAAPAKSVKWIGGRIHSTIHVRRVRLRPGARAPQGLGLAAVQKEVRKGGQPRLQRGRWDARQGPLHVRLQRLVVVPTECAIVEIDAHDKWLPVLTSCPCSNHLAYPPVTRDHDLLVLAVADLVCHSGCRRDSNDSLSMRVMSPEVMMPVITMSTLLPVRGS